MIFLSFFPEILLVLLILISLLLTAFGFLSRNVLPSMVSAAGAVGLCYFWVRNDLAFFSSESFMLSSDSFSWFLRLVAMGVVAAFGMSLHFNRELSVAGKQKSTLFLLFFALFLCSLALAQNLILLLVSALGMYFCSMNIIFLESGSDGNWVRVFRQKALWIATWMILVVAQTAVAISLFGSFKFATWAHALSEVGFSHAGASIWVVLVIMTGLLPFASMHHRGRAPLGLAILILGQMFVVQAYWFKLGVPVLKGFSLVSNEMARALMGLLISIISVRLGVFMVRTRDHHQWYSAALPVTAGLILFTILLPSGQGVPAFFILSSGLLLTLPLVAHAFSDEHYANKTLILIALIALLGAPPLVMGDRYYQMLQDLLSSGSALAAVAAALIWLLAVLGSIQFIGRVLLVRSSKENQRSFELGEAFFLAFYLIGMVTLSAFRLRIVSLLNAHPPLNLW